MWVGSVSGRQMLFRQRRSWHSLRWHGAHFLDTSFVLPPLVNKGQQTGFDDLPWAQMDAKHLESEEELSRPGLAQQTQDIVTCTPCTQYCRATAWLG